MSWQPVRHGYICERVIGSSLPVDGSVAIISYEGVHFICFARPDSVVHHPDLAEGGGAYDREHQRLNYDGRLFSIVGLHGGTPRMLSSMGESLAFAEGDEFIVRDAEGHDVFSHAYTYMSGDWRVVTFTADDTYIRLGLPYELEIYRRAV